jgi:NADH-quinone oxidoreductase subunit M
LAVAISANRAPTAAKWLDEVDCAWAPDFGIHFHLAVDGLSLLMLMLTFFLGIIAVLTSWTEIREKVGFFHFNLMWVLAGIVGVFLAVDLFLFYFAWELMLVPMYFLIVIWGHERRVYAGTKFFLFTQCSGLLMLIAILALYFIHHQATGVYTFEYSQLLGTPLAPSVELLLMLGFFVAFAVKLPVVPLHTWLPDAHTNAPTAGSVILAGLLLKTGGYGLLRFVVPLFPRAAHQFTPVALALAVIGILYGAVMATPASATWDSSCSASFRGIRWRSRERS